MPRDLTEYALDEADRMRMDAGRMNQLGFNEVARFLRENADKAMKWAARNATVERAEETKP